jgi:hypothetical protein
MEVEEVKRIMMSSEACSNVKYIKYLRDGDSKTFYAIKAVKVYRETTIEKFKCVGHVQHRMGGNLRILKSNLKTHKLSDDKILTGKW